jgi:hypothetical protein
MNRMAKGPRSNSGQFLRVYAKRLAILGPVILLSMTAIGLNLLLFGFILPEFLMPPLLLAALLSGLLAVILLLPLLLGLYPSISALLGYRLAILVTFIPLLAIVIGVVVFILSGYQISELAVRLDFSEVMQEGSQHVRTYRLDTNGDGYQEWVVLYRFDLPSREQSASPIAGVVYQPDGSRPPNFIAHELRPPGGEYLCECDCRLNMENVLSGLEGDELVVRDRCNDEITRLTIFHWDPATKKYNSPGHFLGGDVEVSRDQVVVKERLPGRAQSSLAETYYPDDSKTYYQQDAPSDILEASKEEIVFALGEPEDVLLSPYPEKVVLAFYNHYNDDEKAPEYFAESVQAYLGQCDAGGCGCIAPRHEVTHVRVTRLQLETYNEGQEPEPNRATVGAWVICELRDGRSEGEKYIRWYLVREDDRWRLERPE